MAIITGTEFNDEITGTTSPDVIDVLDGDDAVDGGDGNDTINGGAGNDSLGGGLGSDTINGGQGDDEISSGIDYYFDGVKANAYGNFLNGDAGNDFILGGAGNDNITGGDGNDVLYGGLGSDFLSGGAGNDVLDGGPGVSSMAGGAGDDTYYLTSENFFPDPGGQLGRVVENPNEGIDTIIAASIDVMPLNNGFFGSAYVNIENVILTGLAPTTVIGNALNNWFTGNDAPNVLDGQAGVDRLEGRGGNDTYVLDVVGDVVIETANGGTDTVMSPFSYILLENFENLKLTGSASIIGRGNAANNAVTGNSGANILHGFAGNDSLNGGAGDDRLYGGEGNDTVFVDTAGDIAFEAANQGTDTVVASINYVLPAYFETLRLAPGGAALNGTGNSFANVLLGNDASNAMDGLAGDDRLNGGLGFDTLAGGIGHDTYILESTTVIAGANTWDTVTEGANEGVDTVFASADAGRYTHELAANVENLVATGVAVFRLWGNVLANALTGNAAFNELDGFGGNDVLTGGGGIDEFDFSTFGLGNTDTIVDFVHLTDKIGIDASVFGGGLTGGVALASVRLVVGPVGGTPIVNQAFGQFLYDRDDGRLLFDADGTGIGAAVHFATLTGAPALTVADFQIVA